MAPSSNGLGQLFFRQFIFVGSNPTGVTPLVVMSGDTYQSGMARKRDCAIFYIWPLDGIGRHVALKKQ